MYLIIAEVRAYMIFGTTEEELNAKLDPANYTGRSAEQVDEFLRECVRPILNGADLAEDVELTV